MTNNNYNTHDLEHILMQTVSMAFGEDIAQKFAKSSRHHSVCTTADDIISASPHEVDPSTFFLEIFKVARDNVDRSITEMDPGSWVMTYVFEDKLFERWARKALNSAPPQEPWNAQQVPTSATYQAEINADALRRSSELERMWAEAEARGKASAEAGPAPRYQEPKIVLEGRPSEPYWVSRVFDDLPRYQEMWTDKDMRDVTALKMNEEAEARIQKMLDAGHVPPVGRVAEWFTEISGVKPLQHTGGGAPW